jgi:hypothetical protein
LPPAVSVAVPVVLALATKVMAGAVVLVHDASLTMAATWFSVADGVEAVPMGEAGVVTLSSVICAMVSAPLVLTAFEYAPM